MEVIQNIENVVNTEKVSNNGKEDAFKFHLRIFLVDYENVKRAGLNGIENCDEFDKVIILYSEVHNTLTFDIHSQLNGTGATIEYQCVKVGRKDSLDHQLSSYLGFLISRNPLTEFYIVSADMGFDFICDFWNNKNFKVGQVLNLKMDTTIINKPAPLKQTAQPAKKVATPNQATQPDKKVATPNQATQPAKKVATPNQATQPVKKVATQVKENPKISLEQVTLALKNHSEYAQSITDIINSNTNRTTIFNKIVKLVSDRTKVGEINKSIRPLIKKFPG